MRAVPPAMTLASPLCCESSASASSRVSGAWKVKSFHGYFASAAAWMDSMIW